MIVRDASEADVRAIVPAMRADDAREVYALRFTREPDHLVADILARRPFMIGLLALCGADGAPIGLLGATLAAPHLADVLMVATDDWPKIALAATRASIRRIIPAYLDANVRRAECRCWVGNSASRVWLEKLGFEAEGVLRRLGGNGEDFLLYARLNPHNAAGEGRA